MALPRHLAFPVCSVHFCLSICFEQPNVADNSLLPFLFYSLCTCGQNSFYILTITLVAFGQSEEKDKHSDDCILLKALTLSL
jgi:hypothetical protein